MRSGILRGLAAVGVCLAGVATSSPDVLAATVPFTDPAAHGYIGLCNAAGRQITSGSLSDKPFVVRAVSSTPAPSGYTVRQGVKATLLAYQPIDGIDPGDWSGEALTGSAFFSNAAHPMTAGTVLDYSMGDFVGTYPVHWDRLVQLRIYYGQPDKPTYTTTYPAAVLQIDGSRWQVVQGGTVDCSDGKTMPTEKLALPPSRFASASAAIAASKSAAAARSVAHSGGGDTSSVASGKPTATRTSGATSGRAQDNSRGGSESPADPRSDAAGVGSSHRSPQDAARTVSGGTSWSLVVILLVVVLAVAGSGGWWIRTRMNGR